MSLDQLSVIIPTRNSRSLIEPHLDTMLEWLPHVGEIIGVDSFSEDGTLEFLREKCAFPHAEFQSHPPGLYASWNAAIRKATRPFLYVATAGDAINRDDLEYLVQTAASTQADVVTSSPHFFEEDGRPLLNQRWPLHEVLEAHPGDEVVQLSGPELAILALQHCSPPFRYDSWLGSSASNVYRTAVLQAHPFREDAGHGADTYFGIENALRLKAAFCRRRCGRFILHGPGGGAQKQKQDKQRLFEIFDAAWLNCFNELCRSSLEPHVRERLEATHASFHAESAKIMADYERFLEEEHAALLKEMGKKKAQQDKVAELQAQVRQLQEQAKQAERQLEGVVRQVPGWMRRLFRIQVTSA